MACRKQTEIAKIFVITILLCTSFSCNNKRDTTELFFYCTDSIQNGDLILRKSYGMISEIISTRLKDTVDISHCGILIQDSTGNFNVIHSLSKKVSDYDGMQQCSLQEFWEDSRPETVRVFRFRNSRNYLIAQCANNYLVKKIPFDNNFDTNDTTAFYCSELPVHIIEKTFRKKIINENSIIKFSTFMNPDNFREIVFKHKKSPSDYTER